MSLKVSVHYYLTVKSPICSVKLQRWWAF